MEDKILFMIYKNEIKFMTSPIADHWRWYQSLGGDPNSYDSVVRGYISKNKIIFFKSNYSYDDEVVNSAKEYGLMIIKHLNIENGEVYCGIERKEDGSYRPGRYITRQDMENYRILKEQEAKEKNEKLKQEELMKSLQQTSKSEELIEFKNDYTDESFTKYAISFSIVILVLTILSKIYLVSTKKLYIDNRWNSLIVFIQIISQILSIYFYKKKSYLAKYTSILTTASLFITFNFTDIVIATFNLFFTVDQKYIITFVENSKKAYNKTRETVDSIEKTSKRKNKKVKRK